MKAYIIIGSSNTRKSSTCRALTGCFNRSIRDIRDTHQNDLDVYVRVSSLQESETTPKEFHKEVMAKKQNHVLFCLWPTENPKNPQKYPNAAEYVKFLTSKGWVIAKVAILGSTASTTIKAVSPKIIQTFINAPSDPINITAESVRKHFNWI